MAALYQKVIVQINQAVEYDLCLGLPGLDLICLVYLILEQMEYAEEWVPPLLIL